MKILKIFFIALSLILALSILFSFLGQPERIKPVSINGSNLEKKAANLIVLVNWNGHITNIYNYQRVLENQITEIVNSTKDSLQKKYELNIVFAYFGLVNSDFNEPPDFSKNYIKIIHGVSTWDGFYNHLRHKEKGHWTASTTSKYLVLEYVQKYLAKSSENYLLLVSDNFYNAATADQELRDIRNTREVGGVEYAIGKLNEFHKRFNWNTQWTLNNGNTNSNNFFIELNKLGQVQQFTLDSFLAPNTIYYENISSDSSRILFEFSSKINQDKNSYKLVNLSFSFLDKKKLILKDFIKISSDKYNYSYIRNFPNYNIKKPFFKINANLGFKNKILNDFYLMNLSKGINIYEKNHKFGLFFSVKGLLLDINNKLELFSPSFLGSILTVFLIITLSFWLILKILPYIVPPVPKINLIIEQQE